MLTSFGLLPMFVRRLIIYNLLFTADTSITSMEFRCNVLEQYLCSADFLHSCEKATVSAEQETA